MKKITKANIYGNLIDLTERTMPDDVSVASFYGGTDNTNSAIKLYGKSCPEQAGDFEIIASDGTNSNTLKGTVSKDMRGIYNLCHINDFDINTEYQYSKLPISEKCKSCQYYGRCFALNTFSAFVKDILDKINYEPHFCRFTKIYHKYQ